MTDNENIDDEYQEEDSNNTFLPLIYVTNEPGYKEDDIRYRDNKQAVSEIRLGEGITINENINDKCEEVVY